jgi:hypothetical protein
VIEQKLSDLAAMRVALTALMRQREDGQAEGSARSFPFWRKTTEEAGSRSGFGARLFQFTHGA